MQNTTPNLPALESIDTAALLFVSGGCHKRCGGCCGQQQTVINMPQQAQAQPQAAPSPLPQAAPQAQLPPSDPSVQAAPSGDVVSTSVSINGQPVG